MSHVIAGLIDDEIEKVKEVKKYLNNLIEQDTGKLNISKNEDGSYALVIEFDEKKINSRLTMQEIYRQCMNADVDKIRDIIKGIIIQDLRKSIIDDLEIKY